jgi:hypothetical protein
MLSHFVLKTLAGPLRKQLMSGGGLPFGGRTGPRPYKPWRLWRAALLGLGVAVLAQAYHWLEIYRNFETLSFVAATNDLVGRLDVMPVIFAFVAAIRNAIMKRRRPKK